MIKGLKICGVSDPKTLAYILNHRHKPSMIGFITNYEKSRRFVEYEKLKDLINIDKKKKLFLEYSVIFTIRKPCLNLFYLNSSTISK